MPTVRIMVSERVTYCREVEMPETEFREWDDRLDRTKGREYEDSVEELTNRYIRRDDRDWMDVDDLELQDMALVL